MSDATAKISVETELQKVIEDLQKISRASQNVSTDMEKMSLDFTDVISKNTTKTQKLMDSTATLASRVATRMKDDFKSLLSLNALQGALSLSNQFSGTLTKSVQLSDTIRKLSSIFGIAKNDFGNFQSAMVRGLGNIGLSSEAASNALLGLAETPVRGQQALIEYSKTAGELASISGQQGREGDIAKGIAQVITAQGGNANDISQMRQVSDQILRIRNATGKGATEAAGTLTELFKNVNEQFKPMLKKGGVETLGTAAMLGGPQATAFLEKYLSMNKFQRMGLEAQGLGKIITPQGTLDRKAIESTLREAKGRGMGDVQAGLGTMGFSEEEAKGFIRLSEAMKENEKVINGAKNSIVDLNEQYKEGRTLGEAFRANINNITGAMGGIGRVLDPIRNLLNSSADNKAASAGVVVGGGVLAALLAGGALKGIGGALGKGFGGMVGGAVGGAIAKEAGATPVYVVNAAEIRGGGVGDLISGGASASGGTGLMSKLGLLGLGGAAAAGVAYAGYKQAIESEEKVMKPLNDIKKKDEETATAGTQIGKDFSGYKIEGMKQSVDVNLKVYELPKGINIQSKPRHGGTR